MLQTIINLRMLSIRGQGVRVRKYWYQSITQYSPVLSTGWYYYWLSHQIPMSLRHLDTNVYGHFNSHNMGRIVL